MSTQNQNTPVINTDDLENSGQSAVVNAAILPESPEEEGAPAIGLLTVAAPTAGIAPKSPAVAIPNYKPDTGTTS